MVAGDTVKLYNALTLVTATLNRAVTGVTFTMAESKLLWMYWKFKIGLYNWFVALVRIKGNNIHMPPSHTDKLTSSTPTSRLRKFHKKKNRRKLCPWWFCNSYVTLCCYSGYLMSDRDCVIPSADCVYLLHEQFTVTREKSNVPTQTDIHLHGILKLTKHQSTNSSE